MGKYKKDLQKVRDMTASDKLKQYAAKAIKELE